jgi:hypothetical protein
MMFAITNQHVIGDNWQENLSFKPLMISLRQHVFWNNRPIFVSPSKEKMNILYPPHFPKDIAIYPADNYKSKLLAANKCPAKLLNNNPVIHEDDILLVVGYPGKERKYNSGPICQHSLVHIFGTVRSVSKNNIIIQDNNPKREKNISLGGISGGPIFKINDDGTYQLIGITYEGKGNIRKNEENEDETFDDIWIYGFPIHNELLSEIINKNWPTNKST